MNKATGSKHIPESKQARQAVGKTGTVKRQLLDVLDDQISRNWRWIIWVFLSIAFVFSLLLFDSKVSLTGDDSFYIIRAYDFIHKFSYPSFQGPLYPMVLSIIMLPFGLNVIALKVFSLFFILVFIYLTYTAFRDRIPATILFMVLALTSINGSLLYYASQTYSEAFYLMLLSLVFLAFFRLFIDREKEGSDTGLFKRHLVFAATLLTLLITRSIGFSAVLAVGGYFLLQGQWRNLIISIISIILVFAAFQGIKYLLWGDAGLQFSQQGAGLLQKDYYNAAKGNEDFAGMLKRFYDNSNLYLSKHFLLMNGLRKISQPPMAVYPLVSLLIYLMSFTTLFFSLKRNRYIFFATLTGGAFLLTTFIVLQANWDQERLIVPAYHLLLIVLFSALYFLFKTDKGKSFQWLLPGLFVIIFFTSLGTSASRIRTAHESSGKYGGLTPDWKHYLQASEWAAKNLPEDAIIACRKPSISFIYGKGREFYPIMQLPVYNTERFMKEWKEKNLNYFFFPYAELSKKQVSLQLYNAMKKHYTAQVFLGDTLFLVAQFPDSIVKSVVPEINKLNISYLNTYTQVEMRSSKKGATFSLYYPDSLMNALKQNGVTHVITASLRMNPLEKTGRIINTVERYVGYIQDKYPGFLSPVTQIGGDEDEPARIFRLVYPDTGNTKE